MLETAETSAESNMCMDINTRGLRKPCQEMVPNVRFLRILHQHSVSVIFGSDAHELGDVGRNFREAIRLARKVGYTHACTFDRRERTSVGKFS